MLSLAILSFLEVEVNPQKPYPLLLTRSLYYLCDLPHPILLQVTHKLPVCS